MKKYIIFSLSIFTLLILSSCGSEDMLSSEHEESDGSDKTIAVVKPNTKAIEAPQLPSASLSPTEDIKALVN